MDSFCVAKLKVKSRIFAFCTICSEKARESGKTRIFPQE